MKQDINRTCGEHADASLCPASYSSIVVAGSKQATDLVNNGCCDERILENVLAKVLVEHETLCVGLVVDARLLLNLHLAHLAAVALERV